MEHHLNLGLSLLLLGTVVNLTSLTVVSAQKITLDCGKCGTTEASFITEWDSPFTAGWLKVNLHTCRIDAGQLEIETTCPESILMMKIKNQKGEKVILKLRNYIQRYVRYNHDFPSKFFVDRFMKGFLKSNVGLLCSDLCLILHHYLPDSSFSDSVSKWHLKGQWVALPSPLFFSPVQSRHGNTFLTCKGLIFLNNDPKKENLSRVGIIHLGRSSS